MGASLQGTPAMGLGSGVRVKILSLNNGQWSGKPDPWTQWTPNHCRKCRRVMGGFPTLASCFRCVLGSVWKDRLTAEIDCLLIPDLSSGNSPRVLDKFWLMYLDLGSVKHWFLNVQTADYQCEKSLINS